MGFEMKKQVLVGCLLLSGVAFAEDDQDKEKSTVSDVTKSVMSNIVSFGKNLVDGAADGVTEGRKDGQSVDGAIVVSNLKELDEHLEVRILGVSEHKENQAAVELGFRNSNDIPVRVIDLRDDGAVIVIDGEGYASNLASGNPADVTVPEKAGKKQVFYFNVQAVKVKQIRIHGKTLTR